MAALIFWYKEKTWSIQSVNTIVEPKKVYGDVFRRGEQVEARYAGNVFPGILIHLSNDREELKLVSKELEQQLKSGQLVEEIIDHFISPSGDTQSGQNGEIGMTEMPIVPKAKGLITTNRPQPGLIQKQPMPNSAFSRSSGVVSDKASSFSRSSGAVTDKASSFSRSSGVVTDKASSFSRSSGAVTDKASSFSRLSGTVTDKASSFSRLSGAVTDKASSFSRSSGAVTDKASSFSRSSGAVTDKASSFSRSSGAVTDKASSFSRSSGAVTDKASSFSRSSGAVTDNPSSFSRSSSAVTDKASSFSRSSGAVTDNPSSFSRSSGAVTDKATSFSRSSAAVTDKASSFSRSSGAVADKASSFRRTPGAVTDKASPSAGGAKEKEDRHLAAADLKDLKRKFVSIDDFEVLEEEVLSMRKRIKKLEKRRNEAAETQRDAVVNGHSKSELIRDVSNTVTEFEAVELLMLKMFSEEDIVSSTISGKRPNSNAGAPKKQFNTSMLQELISILRIKFPQMKKHDVTQKIQNVQKKVHRKLLKLPQ